ncbi:MAG TPA: type VI secretion system baseplate subunit TssG [Gemmataceae bacterium]
MPAKSRGPRRKAIFRLRCLVRLYLGPELDFDVQLLRERDEDPFCRLIESNDIGARLGWNTGLRSLPHGADAEDAVFEGEEVTWLPHP